MAAAAEPTPRPAALSAAELIARNEAPIKPEFLKPIVPRKPLEAAANSAIAVGAGGKEVARKSKQQFKRVRAASLRCYFVTQHLTKPSMRVLMLPGACHAAGSCVGVGQPALRQLLLGGSAACNSSG